MTDLTRDELELEEGLSSAIGQSLKRVRTAMPAEVISFNAAQNTVDVQPLLQRSIRGNVGNMPPVMNVPVVFYGGGGFVVTFKPQSGDVCELIINDRSLDAWKAKGGISDPADHRTHDPSDAVALFGINDYGSAYQSIKDGIDIRTRDGLVSLNVQGALITATIGGTEIARIEAGKVKFTIGSQVLELTNTGLTHNGVNIGSTHRHNYIPGAGTPTNTGNPN
jgi:hypothetical protein